MKKDNKNILRKNDVLPWKVSNNFFKIHLGTFQLSEAYSYISKKFKLNIEGESEFNIEKEISIGNQQSCFATILVNSEGRYIKNSIEVSLMPLSLGNLSKKNDEKIKIEIYKETIDLELNNQIKFLNSYNDILKLEKKLMKITNFSPKLIGNIYYERKFYNNRKNTKDFGILNSFYLKDLNRIGKAIDNNNIGSALSKYLSDDEVEKVDLGKIENLKSILNSNTIPYARWPKNTEHSLSLIQSVAVKLGLDMDKDLLSVNGPPGTGKTTLLKDIIANLIYNRAKVLSKYNDPKNIFKKIDNIKTKSNYSFNINEIDENMSKYSILIASSNNGAVENISKELPLKENISNEFLFDEDIYFSKVSDRILGEETWGMLAAILGNKSNRDGFFDKFWFDKKSEGLNIQKCLYSCDKIPWKEAVKNFNLREEKVENEIKRIKEVEKLIYENSKLYKLIKDREKKYNNLKEDYYILEKKKRKLKNKLEELKKCKKQKINLKKELIENRPLGIFSFLNKEYRVKVKKIKNNIRELIIKIETLNEKIKKIKDKYEIKKRNIELEKKEIEIVKSEFENNKKEIEKMKKDAKENFVDYSYWEKNYEDLQISSPWLYKKLNKLRSELFIESLKLHKAMIIENRSIFKKDIIPGITSLLSNSLELEDSQKYGDIIWNNFFLIMPVVSSTFASIESMAKYLKKESIGWLLIDEAGQTVPQAAAGAIWRSKNVMVVGDPLQIPPVVTTPDFIFSRIREFYNIKRDFISKGSSVQLISDKVNKFGGYINENWVGTPLKVHRRCINPMFNISNKIAYDKKMVCATIKPKEEDRVFNNSYWFNIKGKTSSKHFVKEQGDFIKKLIEIKYRKNKDPELYIISPFSDVAQKLKLHLCNCNLSKRWIENSIGTIHTFQGKEEKTIILCLGLDENSIGAANWASSTPNILNVAVSRGKYELIVVGDINVWGNKNFFDVAKDELNIVNEDQLDDYLEEFKEEIC